MNLLLVLPPPWGKPEMPPLGVAVLVGAAKAAGLDVGVFDLNAYLYKTLLRETETATIDCGPWRQVLPDPSVLWSAEGILRWEVQLVERTCAVLDSYLEPLFSMIKREKPDVIGFSIYGRNLFFAIELARLFRARFPEVKLIFGGPWISFEVQRELLVDAPIDAVVAGDGEEILLPLVSRLKNGQGVSGLAKTDWCGDIPLLRPTPAGLSTAPIADYSEFDLDLYEPGVFATQLARGCMRRCRFCADQSITPYRCRPLDTIKAEIGNLRKKYGLTALNFNDQAINWNTKLLGEICDWLLTECPDLIWSANAGITPKLDRPVLDRVREAGCTQLNFGLESGSDAVLRLMGKGFTRELASRIVRDTSEADIKVGLNLIVGYPGETREDFEATCSFVTEHASWITQIQTVNPLMLNHGSPIWDEWKRFEFYDPNRLAATWIDGDNTPWARRALVGELAAVGEHNGIPVSETNPIPEVDQDNRRFADGIFRSGTRWAFYGGRIVLTLDKELLTAGTGLLFDWDVGDERRFSQELDWSRDSDAAVANAQPGLDWEVSVAGTSDGVECIIFSRCNEPTVLDRFKISLTVSIRYDRWKINEQEGGFRIDENWRTRWRVVGPQDEAGHLPFDKEFTWRGNRTWRVSAEVGLPTLLLSLVGNEFHPIVQGHCHPGVSVGFVQTGPLALPVGRYEVCRFRLAAE